MTLPLKTTIESVDSPSSVELSPVPPQSGTAEKSVAGVPASRDSAEGADSHRSHREITVDGCGIL